MTEATVPHHYQTTSFCLLIYHGNLNVEDAQSAPEKSLFVHILLQFKTIKLMIHRNYDLVNPLTPF